MNDTIAASGALDYALAKPRRHDAFGLVGFGLSFVAAALPVYNWWSIIATQTTLIAMGASPGGTTVWVSPVYYLVPLAAVALCVVSLRRGRRWVPLLGIGVSCLAAAATLVLTSRTW